MAFALTSAQCYKLDIANATRAYGLQVIELTITRGTADVSLDFGNIAGTFWTAARADVTFGAYATQVASAVAPCLVAIDRIVSLSLIGSTGPLLQVATASAATNFALTNGGTYPVVSPVVTFNAGTTPAEVKLLAVFALTDLTNPIEFT